MRTTYGFVVSIGVFVLVSLVCAVPVAATELCGTCPSTCCCDCSYSGGGGGGQTICEIEKRCYDGQKAECNCSSGGCTASCKANTNQNLELDDYFELTELATVTPKALCEWITNMDKTWSCSSVGMFLYPLTEDYPTSQQFGSLLDTMAADMGACAEVDETARSIVLRPSGTCV